MQRPHAAAGRSAGTLCAFFMAGLLPKLVRKLREKSVCHFPRHLLCVLCPHDGVPAAAEPLADFRLCKALPEAPGLQGERKLIFVAIHLEPVGLHFYFDLIHDIYKL